MYPSERPAARQRQGGRHYAGNADWFAMFNLLTGPQLFEWLEELVPEHRERLFPPTAFS